jgi:two-component system, OmpR family, response regulator ResD
LYTSWSPIEGGLDPPGPKQTKKTISPDTGRPVRDVSDQEERGMISLSEPREGLGSTYALPETPGEVNGTLLVGLDRLTPAFVAGLEANGIRTYSAENAREALDLAVRLRPELMVVGQESIWDPFAFLSHVREARPDAMILFLAPTNDPGPAMRALTHGADDVVAPPHSLSAVLLRAHLTRSRNGRPAGRPGRGVGGTAGRPVVVDRLSRTVQDGDEPSSLTGREFELFERLLSAGGRVVPRETLLADIWGKDQDSEAVLDATVHRLRRKLEDDPAKPVILTTVRGVGYRLETSRLRVDTAAAPS